MHIMQSRRNFLTTLSAAGAAGALGARSSLADEGPPETTTVRLVKYSSICVAPFFVAEQLLHAEGFTDVRYVTVPLPADVEALARGEVDFNIHFSPEFIIPLDVGKPITIVGGVHSGCFELFAKETIRSIADLKGKSVGVPAHRAGPYLFLASMAGYVGLDPANDIDWVTSATVKPIELFKDGKIDAFLGFPPEPQELHALKLGHVIVDSSVDRPWSQYFCCVIAGNADFVRNNPVATKRVLRAVLKAADLCVVDPKRVAQRLVDGGFTARYDYALQALSAIPYDRWRDYDPEDAIRFYALRLHEVGMIKSTPNTIIAQGTDWRFLNELKRELKA
jgi:NitT/TauT family transport system substrate-binding protein